METVPRNFSELVSLEEETFFLINKIASIINRKRFKRSIINRKKGILKVFQGIKGVHNTGLEA